MLATSLRLLRQKCASQDRLNRKHIEEFMRHQTGTDHLRIAGSSQAKVVSQESRHAFEDPVPLLVIEEACRRESRFAAPTVSARVGSPHHNNPLRVLVWKWPKQSRIHYTEDRGVRSDAERERDHGHQSEPGILRQHSHTVAQVLANILNPSHTASVPTPLLRLFYAAECFASSIARLFRIHPQPDVLFRLSIDMLLQLFIQLTFDLPSSEQRS